MSQYLKPSMFNEKVYYLDEAIQPLHDNKMLFLDSTGFAEILMVEGQVGGFTKFRGKFQEAEAENKNKRRYPYDILESNRQRLLETIKARGLVGELDHPTDSIVHFEKASHVITDLWWEGNVLMGEGEILPTPHGKILENLIKSGVRVGISSRGVGNGQTDRNGTLVIGESYKLITFDAVADPSTFDAYQKAVAGASKRESIMSQSVMTNNVNNHYKNETTSIDSITNKAVAAYLGQVIRNHKDKILHEGFNANKRGSH